MWYWAVLRRDLSQETQPAWLIQLQEVSKGGLWCATLALSNHFLLSLQTTTGTARGRGREMGKHGWSSLIFNLLVFCTIDFSRCQKKKK